MTGNVKGLDSWNPAQAYLLEGPGPGLDQGADLLAKRILCEKGGADPERFLQGNCADFLGISDEKISMDIVRDLIGQIYRKPLEGKFKVFLLYHADDMREDAQNALLKSLEEPPDYLVWILCASNRMKLLPTIRSRCRIIRVDVMGLGPAIKEGANKIDDIREGMVPEFDNENWNRIFSMLEMAFSGKQLKIFLSQDPYTAWTERKNDLLDAIGLILFDMLQYKASGKEPGSFFSFKDYKDKLIRLAEISPLTKIEKAIRQVDDLKGLLNVNINFRMALDNLFMHWGE